MTKNILLVSSHPNLSGESFFTKTMIEAFCKEEPAIQHHHLDDSIGSQQHYDVVKEQNILTKADVLLLQFPFHWYSFPHKMKQWIDEVYLYGFAYGVPEPELKGMPVVLSFSAGGPQEAYTPSGYNRFSIEEMTKPLDQIFHLCQMVFHKPFVFHGAKKPDAMQEAQVKQALHEHAKKVLAYVKGLL